MPKKDQNIVAVKKMINDSNELTKERAKQFRELPLYDLKRRSENEAVALMAQKASVTRLEWILSNLEEAKLLLEEERRGVEIRTQRDALLKLLVLKKESDALKLQKDKRRGGAA